MTRSPPPRLLHHMYSHPEYPRSIMLVAIIVALKELILFYALGTQPAFSSWCSMSLKSPIRSQAPLWLLTSPFSVSQFRCVSLKLLSMYTQVILDDPYAAPRRMLQSIIFSDLYMVWFHHSSSPPASPSASTYFALSMSILWRNHSENSFVFFLSI